MNHGRWTSWLVASTMFVAAVLAYAAKPRERIADSGPPLSLEEIVPRQIQGWKVDETIVPVVVDPRLQATVDKLYNQTLARTYFNASGDRIMLSIAYGGDQSDSMQVHRPEVCYSAQGFRVLREVVGELATQYGRLPVKRLLAVQGQRNEPITYWVTVGDKATQVGLQQKLHQLKYGLTGKVPDGMLVRISSISRSEQAAFDLQERFVQEMLAAMPDQARVRIAGRFGA